MDDFQRYPSWRYHRDGSARIIQSDEEHEALYAQGWRDTPAAFGEPEPEAPKKKKK